MRRKIFLLLVFLFLASASSRAAVFVVTNNADSGPGTLRDAIAQSTTNGNTANTINFNFADTTLSGRTITLTTLLPHLAASLTIDGTTQPGTVFGYSGAKVRIISTYQDTPGNVYIFKGADLNNLAITGIWMQSTAVNYAAANVIDLTRTNNLTINKCVIQGGQVYIDSAINCYFKSNFVGFLPDGITVNKGSLWLQDCVNATIGGTTAEGNLFSGQLSVMRYMYEHAMNYTVTNNILGLDHTGTITTPDMFLDGDRITFSWIYFYHTQPWDPENEVVNNNKIANFTGSGIYINQGNDVTIKGNLINTDATGTINYFKPPSAAFNNTQSKGINFGLAAHLTVGGSLPGDANIIGNVGYGVYDIDGQQLIISQNSIFCTQGFNQHYSFYYAGAAVTIRNYTNSNIGGNTIPNATVELFYDDSGKCNSCDPRHYFASTTADAQGNWSYSGNIPTTVSVSAITPATPYSHTSAFTHVLIDQKSMVVNQPTCTQNGSITGIKFYNVPTDSVFWLDRDRKVISHSLDLLNVPPGIYKLRTGTASCSAEIDYIQLFDPVPKIDTSNMIKTNATCHAAGSISGITASIETGEILSYVWTDQNGTVTASDLDVPILAPGKYLLTVTGSKNGCTAVYSITIKPSPSPYIDESAAAATPCSCGLVNGSVTGIQVIGATGYQWFDGNGKLVSNTLALTNVPPGDYHLLASNTECTQQTATYTVTRIPVLAYGNAAPTVVNDNCAAGTGSIKGITVTGGKAPYKYLWQNSSGNTVGTTANITDLAADVYTLTITDATNCPALTQSVLITDQPLIISPPAVNNLQLCGKGAALIAVNNPAAGYGFRLYDSNNSVTPLKSSSTGKFGISATANRSYFVSQYKGTCESTRAEVKVSVGISPLDIANTFTPNGDGINDTWNIQGIDGYPNAIVQVYNRSGQKVFESKGYAAPFDGRMKGQDLPVGAYYYLINIGAPCDVISGSITIVR